MKDSGFFLGVIRSITLIFQHPDSTIKEMPGPMPYAAASLCFEKVEGLASTCPQFPGCLGASVLWAATTTWGSWSAGGWNIWGGQKNLTNPIDRGWPPGRRWKSEKGRDPTSPDRCSGVKQ